MTTKLPIPALSIDDLERFAPAGVVASMDAPTLGAFVRLLSHAWKQEPPRSLAHPMNQNPSAQRAQEK